MSDFFSWVGPYRKRLNYPYHISIYRNKRPLVRQHFHRYQIHGECQKPDMADIMFNVGAQISLVLGLKCWYLYVPRRWGERDTVQPRSTGTPRLGTLSLFSWPLLSQYIKGLIFHGTERMPGGQIRRQFSKTKLWIQNGFLGRIWLCP